MNQFINNVFYYGYYPGCNQSGLPPEIIESTKMDHRTETRANLKNEALDAFQNAINNEIQPGDKNKTHVIPLSSGLDSRAILVTLLKQNNIQKEDILTVTFGSPGTWDFEIAQKVATRADVYNEAIDLTDDSFDWSISSLEEYASTRDSPIRILDGYINSRIIEFVPSNSIIWSGFMGGESAGDHQPERPAQNWKDACEYFIEREQYCSGLSHPDYDPKSVLPDEPFFSHEYLSYEEQMDFAFRQQCLISPIVIFSGDYRTPFMQQSWLEFTLNLKPEHRRNRNLFKRAFLEGFPDIFSIPTDANNGYPLFSNSSKEWLQRKYRKVLYKTLDTLDINYLHPATNYFDFETALRTSGKLKDTMRSLVVDFESRDIVKWLRPLDIWKDHQQGNDRTNEIRTMCSLELYFDTHKYPDH